MTDITWHDHSVTRQQREALLGQSGCVVWFTGLSGSGKSTVANAVDHKLYAMGVKSYLLDGDNVRHGLNASPQSLSSFGEVYAQRFGLGFGAEDRQENIRRIGAVSQLFVASGLITLTAFVSPYRQDREAARQQIVSAGNESDFVEVFVDTPLEVCESRDPKGLYKKARAGKIKNFTGISDPYEAPENPELVLDGSVSSSEQLADEVVTYLKSIEKISL
jgi:adenylylsulfate kinase